MNSKVLKSVIYSVLAIALSSLLIVGWIVFKQGPTEPLNPLILIASNVASGLIGFMTGEAVDKLVKPDKEPDK